MNQQTHDSSSSLEGSFDFNFDSLDGHVGLAEHDFSRPYPLSLPGMSSSEAHIPNPIFLSASSQDERFSPRAPQPRSERRLRCPSYHASLVNRERPGCNDIRARNMGEVYSHLNKAHPLFVAACPVCKLIVESREAKASHGDNFEMCGREKSQWSDLGVHWEALFRKLYPAILAVPSAYHGERNSSPVPHGNVRYVDRVAPAQYPSTRGSRPGTPVHSIPPQRRIMDMPFQSRPSSPNPAASTSSTFPTVGHAITSPSIPLETLPEAHLPKDIIAENRILRELLLKDRRERLPEGERDSVASQVEDEIRLWLQREQSATVPNFTSRSAGSHAPWSLFNTH